MNTLKHLIAVLALLGVTQSKEHYINEDPVVENEHALAKATTGAVEFCVFNDQKYPINKSTNKFCVTVQGEQRLGFDWQQQF